MKENRKITLDAFLTLKPVFRLEEYADAQGKSPAGTRNQIKYHVRRGRVKRVAASVYAAVPFGQDSESFFPDTLLVAACLRPSGVFSHHTALELQGVGHSAWNLVTLFCEDPPASQRLGEQRIHFLSFPGVLDRNNLTELGVRHLDRRGRQVTCTGPERTLIEGFRQPRWVGGLEELVTSASGFPSLDLGLLEQILKAYDQGNLWASAGWFLERYREQFLVPEAFLNRLERHRPSKPRYLVRLERGGTFVHRWNLVVPSRVLHWEGQRAQP